jgi:prepilin-type N-terminal cleavage/methylation domain-containing protein
MKFPAFKQKGFTLVETLVAISILMLAILGPLSIATAGLRNSAFARDQITAFYLAQEGIEFVRYARDDNYLRGAVDADWLEHLDDCKVENEGFDHGCIIDVPYWFNDADGAIDSDMVKECSNEECDATSRQMYVTPAGMFTYDSAGDNTPSPYKRVVKLEKVDGTFDKETKITSTVTWNLPGGGEKVFVLTEFLSNIYEQ